MRRSLSVVLLVAGLVAGSAVYRRRITRRCERVELYSTEGSMITLTAGSPEAEQLLLLARDLLAVAR